ncbi:flavin-containing monooxygenase [Methylobacterium trifolii]|uniref:FAD-containing monooxygenase EthA n=1 Tax=Methylobacterium trifolii TaxID=1003092 RepID=A0ABQ4U683_9HYPH|nr:NAD(P)/FAD-dependent oxidoreductase [Methylobacterium trifolii]GJE62449.1 FAD-containing monooxygenase EthA [Methylobacterium trifolii]
MDARPQAMPTKRADPQTQHFDVLVIGAGISGIATAHYLQADCPRQRYAILEGREAIGGTWDLFRYPGLRSDSDLYTFGYSFRPWRSDKAIADGGAILRYIRETAAAEGIDRHIRFGHRVVRAAWDSQAALWTVEAEVGPDRTPVRYTCGFLSVCSGYYSYEGGYSPEFPGLARFGGRVVHPQAWPEDLAYDGRQVVVIGSGATAVTLVPEMAKQAAHVTMLQRSPTYIVALPSRDKIANWLRARLPGRLAHGLARWKNVLLSMFFYNFARQKPEAMTRRILDGVRAQLGPDYDVAKHFTPAYKPWDQRLCLVPDGDLFKAIRSGRASVETDRIETFTETGVQLTSGKHLEADVVVTATGLRLTMLGGMKLTVDGTPVDPSETFLYKGMMLSGVPNLAVSIGYTNASWTLKCELTARYLCRLLNHMEARGYAWCAPEADPARLTEAPTLPLTSGYVRRAAGILPKQGSAKPWRLYQNYALDMAALRFARLDDGTMRFGHAAAARRAA